MIELTVEVLVYSSVAGLNECVRASCSAFCTFNSSVGAQKHELVQYKTPINKEIYFCFIVGLTLW